MRQQVQLAIHGGATYLAFPSHALIAPGAEQFRWHVGQFDIFDFLATDEHFADGVEAQPFPALTALVDGDFFRTPVKCVSIFFPDDYVAIGTTPGFDFEFRRLGRSLDHGLEWP